MFRDREDAARQLAVALEAYREDPRVVVLAVPRGAVVIGDMVASSLGAPLDVVLVRKIGAPHNPEFAAGAVDEDGVILGNPGAGVDEGYLQAEGMHVLAEVRRRAALYREGGGPPDVSGRTAIVVDDGIATGLTSRAAIGWLRRHGAGKVVLAVPVMAASAVSPLRAEVDDLVVLDAPQGFSAVGQFYASFEQVSDDEVMEVLRSRRSSML